MPIKITSSDKTTKPVEEKATLQSTNNMESKKSSDKATNQAEQEDIRVLFEENRMEDYHPIPQATPQPNEDNLDGVVYIVDETVPIVVLYGPTSCGKSMTLVRMTNYLRSLNYKVEPDRSFRPSNDQGYKKDCDNFDSFVANPMAAPPTTGYMLVDIIKDGDIICKILEAPGEYYFDPIHPNRVYQHYLNTIIMSKNKKIWCVFVEPTKVKQQLYVNRITDTGENGFISSMRTQDSIMVLFNKIDKTGFTKGPGSWDEEKAIKEVNIFYPGLFNAFKEDRPIIKWFKPYTCYFEPFSTGKFGTSDQPYAPSSEEWPERFWKALSKLI